MTKKRFKDFETLAVSFNMLDPDQIELFQHATKRTNVSAYLKRLIQRDLDRELRENYKSNPDSDFN